MTAGQIREAARLLDLLRIPDDEACDFEHDFIGVVFRVGPRRGQERALPLHLVPKRYRLFPDGRSEAEAVPR